MMENPFEYDYLIDEKLQKQLDGIVSTIDKFVSRFPKHRCPKCKAKCPVRDAGYNHDRGSFYLRFHCKCGVDFNVSSAMGAYIVDT